MSFRTIDVTFLDYRMAATGNATMEKARNCYTTYKECYRRTLCVLWRIIKILHEIALTNPKWYGRLQKEACFYELKKKMLYKTALTNPKKKLHEIALNDEFKTKMYRNCPDEFIKDSILNCLDEYTKLFYTKLL